MDKKGANLLMAVTSATHSVPHPWLHSATLWGSLDQTTGAWAPPSETGNVLVWGGALAPVGVKSSPGNSNVLLDSWITVLGNELSAGIISENPTGETEGIEIDCVID